MLRELRTDVINAVLGDRDVGAWKEEDEFVASESNGEVGFTEVTGNDLGECFKKPVAHRVTKCIVHRFEVVEVNNDGHDIGIGLSA